MGHSRCGTDMFAEIQKAFQEETEEDTREQLFAAYFSQRNKLLGGGPGLPENQQITTWPQAKSWIRHNLYAGDHDIAVMQRHHLLGWIRCSCAKYCGTQVLRIA